MKSQIINSTMTFCDLVRSGNSTIPKLTHVPKLFEARKHINDMSKSTCSDILETKCFANIRCFIIPHAFCNQRFAALLVGTFPILWATDLNRVIFARVLHFINQASWTALGGRPRDSKIALWQHRSAPLTVALGQH